MGSSPGRQGRVDRRFSPPRAGVPRLACHRHISLPMAASPGEDPSAGAEYRKRLRAGARSLATAVGASLVTRLQHVRSLTDTAHLRGVDAAGAEALAVRVVEASTMGGSGSGKAVAVAVHICEQLAACHGIAVAAAVARRMHGA